MPGGADEGMTPNDRIMLHACEDAMTEDDRIMPSIGESPEAALGLHFYPRYLWLPFALREWLWDLLVGPRGSHSTWHPSQGHGDPRHPLNGGQGG